MHAPLNLKTSYLNLLIDQVSTMIHERSGQVYELEYGLSLRDMRVLRQVGNAPGITMGQLAVSSGFEKTLVSKFVTALVKRGLLKRHIGKSDARVIQLSLTDAGIALVQSAEPIGLALEEAYRKVFTDTQIKTLHRLLGSLHERLTSTKDDFDHTMEQRRQEKRAHDAAGAARGD